MPFVKRPNKEAFIRALDIYLDEMRTFVIDTLQERGGPPPAASHWGWEN